MNKIVKLTVVLFLICAIVAGVLGGVNLITKDKIAEQDRIKTEKAYAAVLASDNGYTEVSFDKTAFPTVDSINECNNGAGWVVTTTFSGAQGSITMAVGVDTDMKCTGISIISHTETAGLGAVAAADTPVGKAFRQQFAGAGESVMVTKDGGSVDALTGATVTSRAICTGVNAALACAAGLP